RATEAAEASARIGTIAALLLASGALHAQPEADATIPVEPLRTQTPPEPSATDEAAPIALAPIIVTGELITREADQTTSSVAVHTGAEIERGTARDVYEVIRSTPNAGLEDSDYGFG